MSTRALQSGEGGAVVHGFHRDIKEISRLSLPVALFACYAQEQGSSGKVIDWRAPIELNSVAVRPGDVIYGDLDGVIVVPAEAVEQAFAGAIEKVRGEAKVVAALQNVMTAAEAFRKFGIM